MGMERFKWFDYLGALLLLFSVTKSAITPQVSADSLNPLANPETSVNQVRDSIQYASGQSIEFQGERLSPSLGPILEAGSNSVSFVVEVGGEGLEGYSKEILHQALNPTLEVALGEKPGALNPISDSVMSQANPSPILPTLIW
jgi:hypothetical protein